MKKIEYSIAGNDVVPQNMIGGIFFGTPCRLVHMHLNEKIALEIATKIANVNGP